MRDRMALWIALVASGFLLILACAVYVGHRLEPNDPPAGPQPFSLEG